MIKRILLYLVTALCAFAACASAFAAAPIKQYQGDTNITWSNSLEQDCSKFIGYLGSLTTNGNWAPPRWSLRCDSYTSNSYGYSKTCVNPPSGNDAYSCTTVGSTFRYTNQPSTRMRCSDGSAPNTSKPLDQQCPDSCQAGSKGSGTWGAGDENNNVPYKSVFSTGGCVSGCTVEMTDVNNCWKNPPSTKAFCSYDYESTGSVCTAGPGMPAPDSGQKPPASPRIDMPPAQSPGKCPSGSIQGGVSSDGVAICIGTGSDPKNSPPPPPKVENEKTETNPDGSTTTTKTTTTTNSDGSKTTTVTITNTSPTGEKSENTTKNTSNNSAGGAGKDESARDDEKYDLCKQNPMLNICRNSSVSGSCGEISCQGDAIQCATLRAAAAMQCQQKKDLEDLTARGEVAAGNSILSGADPMKGAIDTALKGTEVDMSQPALDSSGFVGSRACLAPRSFSVAGKSITVDFGELCDSIEALRYAVLACAWIVAYLIVSRSVLNS